MLYSKRLSAYGFILFAFISCFVSAMLIHAYAGKNKPNHASGNAYAAANTFYPTCGSTTNISTCATSVRLDADPNQPNYTWNTGETSSSITVTASGVYWRETIDLTATKVINGDFSAGNTGFNSAYNYADATNNNTALRPEATYTITTDPKNAHPDFGSFGDHTTGNGNMMVVNGAPAAVSIWSQSISVTKNTDYIFSVWFTSAHKDNPGRLKFSINGDALVGNAIELTSIVGEWKNFTVRWNSRNNVNANIGIVNQNTIGAGNDFALDDIVFAPVCRNNFNVTFYTSPVKPTIRSL